MTIRTSIIWVGICLAGVLPAKADTRADVLSGIQRCGAIQDNRTWLNCLYGAVQPARAELGLPPAPDFQQRLVPQPGIVAPQPGIAAPRPTAKPAPLKKPSFFQTLIGDAPPVAVSRMASYRYETSGAFVVRLENGQEWRQTNVESGTVSWMKPPSTYMVTVTHGAFGSYNLRTSQSPVVYKVEPAK